MTASCAQRGVSADFRLRRTLAMLCVAATACQVASHSSVDQPEVRLSERRQGAPPPTIAQPSYPVDDRELLGTDWLRPHPPGALEASDGAAFRGSASGEETTAARVISASVATPLAPTTFAAGRSYRLTFKARRLGSSEAKLGIKFRTLEKESFRSFLVGVSSTAPKHYQLDFTAPAFTAAAEFAIDVAGGGVSVEAVSLRMRAPISRIQPVASWAGSFVPDGYGLTFNDEFNGSELDRTRWFTRYIYGSESVDRLNKENSRYADNGNHRLSGGILYLTAKQSKLSQPSGINYESGMIRSDFTARYGFFEARVKMPGGLGVWPAFWLNSDVSDSGKLSWPPEIDIFEFVNNGKEDKVNMLHVAVHGDAPGSKPRNTYLHRRFDARNGEYVAPFNFNDGWHTIGAEWTPKDVSIFVDGLKVVSTTFDWRYRDGTLAAPAHVLLNLAIGDEWAGRHGIDNSAFPQSFAVDWVRVYEQVSSD